MRLPPFSILERIDVGETACGTEVRDEDERAFSILERIDVGETGAGGRRLILLLDLLSVSSNGSTWVKLMSVEGALRPSLLSVSSNGSTWVKPERG